MKKILFLIIVLFNLLPYLHNGKIQIGTMQAAAQTHHSGGIYNNDGSWTGYDVGAGTMGTYANDVYFVEYGGLYYPFNMDGTVYGGGMPFQQGGVSLQTTGPGGNTNGGNPSGGDYSYDEDGGEDDGPEPPEPPDYDPGGDTGGGSMPTGGPMTPQHPDCPVAVWFLPDANQRYGFDNTTMTASKSVEEGKSDVIEVTISPADKYTQTLFESENIAHVTLDPNQSPAPSADFHFTVNGVASVNKGESLVKANCSDGLNLVNINVITYELKTVNAVVSVINSKANLTLNPPYNGYTSSALSASSIQAYLNNNSYNQGVVKWEITPGATQTVDFDINHDYKFDEGHSGNTDEMDYIITNCSIPGYDVNIFLVDNSFTGRLGVSGTPGNYSFVIVAGNPNVLNTVAHELGHARFGWGHDEYLSFPDNFMHEANNGLRKHFYKSQWDDMH